jgi:hypothetical protein
MSKLEINTTSLQTILETINNLPEAGGGSGGGSVETCTVTIDRYSGESILSIITTIIENGVEKVNTTFPTSSNIPIYPPCTITNVKCGSCITVVTSNSMIAEPYIEANGSATYINGYIDRNRYVGTFAFNAPTVANEETTIIADYEP